MRAPTLLIQGENDSLFGLDQANANYRAIHRNGAPVDMVWFAGGHDGGNQETGGVESLTAVVEAVAGAGAAPPGAPAQHSGHRPARVCGDPGARLRPLQRPGVAGHRHRRQSTRGWPGPADPGAAGRPPQVAVSPAGGAPASISVFPGLGALGAARRGPRLTFDMPGQSAAFTSARLSARSR